MVMDGASGVSAAADGDDDDDDDDEDLLQVVTKRLYVPYVKGHRSYTVLCPPCFEGFGGFMGYGWVVVLTAWRANASPKGITSSPTGLVTQPLVGDQLGHAKWHTFCDMHFAGTLLQTKNMHFTV